MSVKQTPAKPARGSRARGSTAETESDNPTGIAASARERAIDAYDAARDKAAAVGTKAGDGIDAAPLVALVGGLAVGALAGALVRKTRLEEKYLAPVGERIADVGRDAVGAARQAGTAKLAELDITRDAGAKLVKSVLDGLGAAARTSGDAALGAVRKRDER